VAAHVPSTPPFAKTTLSTQAQKEIASVETEINRIEGQVPAARFR
jgi:hypothetical protein